MPYHAWTYSFLLNVHHRNKNVFPCNYIPFEMFRITDNNIISILNQPGLESATNSVIIRMCAIKIRKKNVQTSIKFTTCNLDQNAV